MKNTELPKNTNSDTEKETPKATMQFQSIVMKHLEERAVTDSYLKGCLSKDNKSIEECIQFIFTQVMKLSKSGVCGLADDEVFSLAVHYYLEEDISVDSKIQCDVMHNHHVELSEEEIAQAKEKAIANEVERQQVEYRHRNKPKKVSTKKANSQLSLFDL